MAINVWPMHDRAPLYWLPEILPDDGEPLRCRFNSPSAEGRAANLVMACGEMAQHMLTIDCRRTGNHLAMASGTLATLIGKQAAKGQTARLSMSTAPGCMLHGN